MSIGEMVSGYWIVGLRVCADKDGWHVEREGRRLFSGTQRDCMMFAEELFERLRRIPRATDPTGTPR